MKKFLFLCVFFLTCFLANAAGEKNAMFIQLTNGSAVIFKLLNKPCVTFDSSYTYVKSPDMETALPYAYSDIQRIEFGETSQTDMESVQTPDILRFMYITPDLVLLSGWTLEKGQVDVFSIDGKTANVERTYQNNGVYVNLSSLSRGIYIIRANNQSFKIIRK